jgi:hypothetical protein
MAAYETFPENLKPGMTIWKGQLRATLVSLIGQPSYQTGQVFEWNLVTEDGKDLVHSFPSHRQVIVTSEPLPYEPGTKVTVYLDIPGWRGSCYGWVLEDLGSELIVEADDNTFTVVQVAKTSVTLGWAH